MFFGFRYGAGAREIDGNDNTLVFCEGAPCVLRSGDGFQTLRFISLKFPLCYSQDPTNIIINSCVYCFAALVRVCFITWQVSPF